MTRSYSQRSLDNLKGVHPHLRRVIDRALQEGPYDFIVIEGRRTEERQRQLVAEGASRTMNSRHLTGHAVDLLPIGPKGAAFDWALYDKLGPAVEEAARKEGVSIVWGGRWTNFRDGPHFELERHAYPADVPFHEAPEPRPRQAIPPIPPRKPVDAPAPAKTNGIAAAVGAALTFILNRFRR